MGSGPLKGCSYELHSSSYDKANQTTLFFGTFTATHNSDGGPVEPTGKQTVTDYVYALTMWMKPAMSQRCTNLERAVVPQGAWLGLEILLCRTKSTHLFLY